MLSFKSKKYKLSFTSLSVLSTVHLSFTKNVIVCILQSEQATVIKNDPIQILKPHHESHVWFQREM